MNDETLRNIFLLGVQYGLKLYDVINLYKAASIYPTLKKDEEFVCLSGLVVMDGKENISYYNANNLPIIGVENYIK